jgi:hypothetical protein
MGFVCYFIHSNQTMRIPYHKAAAVLHDNPEMFEANVKRAMSGGYVGQYYFPRCA